MPELGRLAVGDELSPITRTLERLHLVLYAAGSGDFNPLHYDPDFPQARQIGDNIVFGGLKYAALGQLVSDWLGHQGFIRRISASYRGMDRRGQRFTCRGRVTGLREEHGKCIAQLELWTEGSDGRRTTEGTAEVVLTRPAPGDPSDLAVEVAAEELVVPQLLPLLGGFTPPWRSGPCVVAGAYRRDAQPVVDVSHRLSRPARAFRPCGFR